MSERARAINEEKSKRQTLAEKNQNACKVRKEKGMLCADECHDTYTCPNSAK